MRISYRFLFLALALLLPAFHGIAQSSKKELEEKRRKIIRDIDATSRMLKKTVANKETTYDRFVALQTQIENREDLIRTLQEEITDADSGIERNQQVIQALEGDISRMREEYGRTVRAAYRRRSVSNPLLFLFSAENLNQVFRRWLFLRKYDRLRTQQAEAIQFTQQMLADKSKSLEDTKTEKTILLSNIQVQQESLTTELQDKDKLLKTLQKDESRLKQDLDKKQTAHEALNQAIERIIQEEVRKQVEASRRPAPAKPQAPVSPPPAAAPTPQPKAKTQAAAPEQKTEPAAVAEPERPADANEDQLSRGFRLAKGKMPWPVEEGFIARKFGRQKHPTLKNIEITNNGIDIRTDEASNVRAIYEGRVAGVQFIPGHDYTVILQHGLYYTVYSNLSEARVQQGAVVKAGQPLGLVSTNPITGSSEIHFELWYQKERLNPSLWIKR